MPSLVPIRLLACSGVVIIVVVVVVALLYLLHVCIILYFVLYISLLDDSYNWFL